MTFGELLKRFREEREYTLRDLGKLAEIDHAYIYRLETGAKEAPSEEALAALVKALKLDHRRARILKYLVGRAVNDLLVEVLLEEASYTPEDFESAAEMSYRGAHPTTKEAWKRLLHRLRKMREEFQDDG